MSFKIISMEIGVSIIHSGVHRRPRVILKQTNSHVFLVMVSLQQEESAWRQHCIAICWATLKCKMYPNSGLHKNHL